MSAGSRVSGRVVALVLFALGFAASCGQLLGDVEVAGDAPAVVRRLCPEVVTAENATPQCPVPPLPVICEEGTTQCTDRLLQLCTDGGRAWVTWQQCASAALCEASDLSTVAACITPKCAVEQMSCEGNLLRLCTEDRTGWQVFDTCKTAAHCDAGKRQCLPAPCEPGDRRCNVGKLERCRDDQMDWEELDQCATNEVCEGTLVGTLPGATQGGVEGQVPLPLAAPAPGAVAEGPTECLAAACLNREVQCDGAQLLACNEGQTGLVPAEPCATPVLCQASIAYTGIRGSPRCVRPTCEEGAHRCSDTGVLEVCNADRTGYIAIEECIGPPFCNAVAADNGGRGCEDAPCESGEERCNGPQIQVCSDDRTRFDPGETCETRDLCNDDNSSDAFCRPPVCQRGPLSGTEFRCQGAVLQRCNDQHTGYDTLNTCATAGLCNAGLAFNGCQNPVCAPGQTRCQGDFVQVCNAQRTGFDNIERCAAGTCDGNAGRCADPCIEGSARCNGQGQLEECRNRLIGREVTARCLSASLCDATARTCLQPPPGCTADGVHQCVPQGGGVSLLQVCTDGRRRFATVDTCSGGEICDPNNAAPNSNVCDACAQNSQPTCQGNDLVSCSADGITPGRVTCPNGCQTVENGPDRCRNCVLGSATCDGAGLLVCVPSGPTNEFRERRPCTTPGACTSTLMACNAGRNGENCSCRPGVCEAGDRDCRGNQPIVCSADLTEMVPTGPSCGTKVCFPNPDSRAGTCGCTPGVDVQCLNGILQTCNRLGVFENEPRFVAGDFLCVPTSGGSGESAVACDGNRIIGPTACAIGCSEESGCAECDTTPGRFTSVCDGAPGGPATHTECVGGQIEERRPCGTQSNECLQVVCQGAGNCNPSSPRPDGTPCDGGRGACEGGVCARCGDGLINGEEDCDSRQNPALEIDDCASGQVGTITCGNNCQIVRTCRTPTCEDRIPDPGEECQPGDGALACEAGQRGEISCVNCRRVNNCANRVCGDGTLDPGEQCDRTPTATCPTGTQGTVRCSNTCTNDTSGCTPIPQCGNNVPEAGEQCDGGTKAICPPGTQGVVRCSSTCTLDTSGCTAIQQCGNNVREGTEACDGMPTASCPAGTQGPVRCSGTCTNDTSGCTPIPQCGNNIREGTEACDGTPTASCPPGTQGPVRCSGTCTNDTSDCTAIQQCGNNIREGTEACDGTPTASCPAGTQGPVRCSGTCTNDTSDCTAIQQCGNNIREGTEACDGTPTASCPAGTQGPVRCSGTCTNDTSDCTAIPQCGNNVPEAGEQCDGSPTASCPPGTQGPVRCSASCTNDTSDCTPIIETDPGQQNENAD